MRNRPSPSGARLSGDDYQHLFTWLNALKLLLEREDIIKVGFEVSKAGNVDDLVIYHINKPTIYNQIKFVTAQAEPLTHEWFTKSSKTGTKTPLQRFYHSLKILTVDDVLPEMALQTNRWPAAEDPLLKLIDGVSGKIMPRIGEETARSDSGKVRAEWAKHLDIDEHELLQMLEHLQIRAAREDLDQLHEQCSWLMAAVGFREDYEAVGIGIGIIRRLIIDGIRELDADQLLEIARSKNLLSGSSRATLLVQSLAHDPWPESATVALDWVDLFEGDDARSRRQLRQIDDWNSRLKPEIREAVDELKRLRYQDVSLAGTMRLSTGLMVGTELSEVAGFRIAISGREGEWMSADERSDVELSRNKVHVGSGDEIAFAMSISTNIDDDVLDFIQSANLPIDFLIIYSPATGANRSSIPGTKEGLGFAHAISGQLRSDTRSVQGTVHLFQASPLPLSVLVGHLWNRMPETQLYDDLGAGHGYAPTFLIER